MTPAPDDKMLIETLMNKRVRILQQKAERLLFGVVCPHAMLTFSAIAAKAVEPDLGTKFFISGLLKDREEMVSMHITGQPGINLMNAGVSHSASNCRTQYPGNNWRVL